MKRFGLQISLLGLLVMPAMFALGWWARDVNYGQTIGRLERTIAELSTQHQNDLLLDELRGVWIETSRRYGGGVIQEKDIDGQPVDVEWFLAPGRYVPGQVRCRASRKLLSHSHRGNSSRLNARLEPGIDILADQQETRCKSLSNSP